MSKYSFWILLALCLLAIAGVFSLKVKPASVELGDDATNLLSLAEIAEREAKMVVGRKQGLQLLERQAVVQSSLKQLRDAFQRRDAENLDFWFPDLGLAWKSAPLVDAFQRQYELAKDRLMREARKELAKQGVKEVTIPLITNEPMTLGSDASHEDKAKAIAEMRRRQREFWIQDRLIRSFAKKGAWLARAIKGGESMGIVASGVSSATFERFRFDIQLYVAGTKLLDAVHALDAPVTMQTGRRGY